MKFLKRSFFFGGMLLLGILDGKQSFAQEWNYAHLSVIYGSPVPFNFMKINDYKNGIRIDGNTSTVLGITLVDSASNGSPTPIGFDLQFRAYNAPPGIESNSNTLPLNTLQIEASNNMGLGTATYTGLQDLSNAWTTLVEYRPGVWSDLDWTTHQVNIQYECGIANNSLLSEQQGGYQVQVEFRLNPVF